MRTGFEPVEALASLARFSVGCLKPLGHLKTAPLVEGLSLAGVDGDPSMGSLRGRQMRGLTGC